MTLPINTEDYGYRFFRNLNEDVRLKSDDYGRWDIDFDYIKGDWVNVNGFNSVDNACIIAIMTRYNELGFMELYEDFGCRIHELTKANKNKNISYRIELFVSDVLNNMRRVEKINWIQVTDSPQQEYQYRVSFSVSCTVDSEYTKEEVDTTIVEEEFLI